MSSKSLKLQNLVFTYDSNIFRCYLDKNISKDFTIYQILEDGGTRCINSSIMMESCINNIKSGYWKIFKNNGKIICKQCKNSYEL